MGAWGISRRGTSGWGGTSATVSVANAFAAGSTVVRVTLNGVPLAADPLAAGDALNPNTWMVTRLDTDQVLPVIDVALVQSPNVFDLSLLLPLANALTQHEINASALLSAGGAPCIPPSTFTFNGAQASREPGPEAAPNWMRSPTQDLRNDMAPTDNTPPATLVLGPNGDYVNVSGPDLTAKMILRRYTTARGAFFHLPNFGAGLQPKALVRTADIPTLQKNLQSQAEMEPTVKSATVQVLIDPANQILYALTNAVDTSGQPVSPVRTPLGSSAGIQF